MGVLAGDTVRRSGLTSSSPTVRKPTVKGPTGGAYGVTPRTSSKTVMRNKLAAKPVQPVSTSATTEYFGGGGGGGSTGGFGGGGGGSTGGGEVGSAPASSADASSAAATSADDALEATLKAIEAQYGMTREQLMSDQGEAGRQFRMALAGLRRQRTEGGEDIRASMIERGILQSGETVENQTELARNAAEAQAQLVGDRDYKRAQIAAQLAALSPQEAADKAAATAQHERAKLDLATLEAMYGGGLA